jgi:serine protease Do
MKKIFSFICLLLIAFVANANPTPPLPIANQSSIAPMLKKAMPAVVNIVNRGEVPLPDNPFLKRELKQRMKMRRKNGDKFTKSPRFTGSGSGVIIDAKQGLIVTNAHVVTMNKNIMVTLSDGRQYQATVIGEDDQTDIAVAKIKADNLTEIPFADSNKTKVGDFVAAIGSPFGLTQSVTAGVVSALNRGNLGLEGYGNFIQTDAPINKGNSGGALVNLKGKLIGINTALLSGGEGNIGIGFAIPSNMVKSIVQQILKFGKVHRGMLGVMVQTLSPDIAKIYNVPKTKGAIITLISPHSPAEKANLKVGDIIVKVNGKKVISNTDIHNITGLLRTGDDVTLNVLRDGKELTIKAKTAKAKDTKVKELKANPYFFGTLLTDITLLNKDSRYIKGIRVIRVDDFSPASVCGLQPNDIIVTANRKKVTSIKNLLAATKATKNDLLLNVIRGPNAGFVVIKKPVA